MVVAMSGGVDSSVAAALLKEAGYDVHGAFIVTWTAPWLPCTWKEERLDAMRVAAELGIPFHTVDLSKAYEHGVVDYLVREYTAGRTPNPDVMCNRQVKFGAFFVWARNAGFDHIATGHYARTNADHQLVRGADTEKDQTYFLWTLKPNILRHVIFPIGDLHKADVRKRAAALGLHTATKKDSQGVCFLGQIDMKEFLRHYVEAAPGTVLDPHGRAIGTHEGALFYTLGERHGFTITEKTPHDAPRYVVAKSMDQNTITVAPRKETTPFEVSRILLKDTAWNVPNGPTDLLPDLTAQIRYRQPPFSVTISTEPDGTATVTLKSSQAYIQAGQSLVLYQGDTCLGGGIIDATSVS